MYHNIDVGHNDQRQWINTQGQGGNDKELTQFMSKRISTFKTVSQKGFAKSPREFPYMRFQKRVLLHWWFQVLQGFTHQIRAHVMCLVIQGQKK